MKAERLKRLEREWAERLRREGFQDIEAPGGMVPQPLSHGVSGARLRKLGQLEQDREATPRMRFLEAWEGKAWELHLEGLSNREVARRCCVYRKLVDQAFARLRRQAKGTPRGRPRDPESLRSHGMRMELLLTPAAALALDHIRAVLKVSKSEVVRRVIIGLARNIPATPHGSGGIPPCSRMGKAA